MITIEGVKQTDTLITLHESHFDARLCFSLLAASAMATPRKENAKPIVRFIIRLNSIAANDVLYGLVCTGVVISVTLASISTKYITKRRTSNSINAANGGFNKSYRS